MTNRMKEEIELVNSLYELRMRIAYLGTGRIIDAAIKRVVEGWEPKTAVAAVKEEQLSLWPSSEEMWEGTEKPHYNECNPYYGCDCKGA